MAEKMCVVSQPLLPLKIVRAHGMDCLPEMPGMIHLLQMRQLVGYDVINYRFRTHDQPPWEI